MAAQTAAYPSGRVASEHPFDTRDFLRMRAAEAGGEPALDHGRRDRPHAFATHELHARVPLRCRRHVCRGIAKHQPRHALGPARSSPHGRHAAEGQSAPMCLHDLRGIENRHGILRQNLDGALRGADAGTPVTAHDRSERLDGAAKSPASAGPTCRGRRRANAAEAAPAPPLHPALRSGFRPTPSVPTAREGYARRLTQDFRRRRIMRERAPRGRHAPARFPPMPDCRRKSNRIRVNESVIPSDS